MCSTLNTALHFISCHKAAPNYRVTIGARHRLVLFKFYKRLKQTGDVKAKFYSNFAAKVAVLPFELTLLFFIVLYLDSVEYTIGVSVF